MPQIRTLLQKHRELLAYLVFGVLTTLVNYLAFLLAADHMSTVAATWMAWVVSVIFAYLTNRAWVFRSGTGGAAALLREFLQFVGARLFSGILDVGVMYWLVDLCGLDKRIIKLASNVLVVVVNYILSKFWIFRKNQD